MAETTDALSFLNGLTGLATRLAVDGIAIHSMSYQSQAFGSWEIEAGRRRVRIRVTWEGKDRQLRVATAQMASGSKERRWQLAEEHDYRKRPAEWVQLFGTVHAAITAHAGV
jgi:hypothetical protein